MEVNADDCWIVKSQLLPTQHSLINLSTEATSCSATQWIINMLWNARLHYHSLPTFTNRHWPLSSARWIHTTSFGTQNALQESTFTIFWESVNLYIHLWLPSTSYGKDAQNGTYSRTMEENHFCWHSSNQARVWSCGICGGQSGAGVSFLRVLRLPLLIFIPPIAPQSPSSGACTIGQKWPQYLVNLVPPH
jgi:hypothetical protein